MTNDLKSAPPKVLVVDDQETARFFATATLTQAGYDVVPAEGGAAALTILAERKIDLIIIDVHMPEMDGFELCTIIRKRYRSRLLPILMMTGADDEESIARSYEVGATDFINKPFKRTLLCQRVRFILRAQKAEQKNHELAHYDSLTGLHNRASFRDRLSHSIAAAKRYNRIASVFFIDLDDFKRVNDTLGHVVGDLLLKGVAKRLQQSIRETDALMGGHAETDELVARVGGDEFTILLPEVTHNEDSAIVAHRILDALAQPFVLAGNEVFISPSIGIALYPVDAQDGENLLTCADAAMYFAKRNGKNLYQFYNESMNDEAHRRLAVDKHLRRAIELNELTVNYQPQMNIATGEICGVEALLRWTNPELGSVSPSEFIPLAEENGLIVKVGEWALRQACEQAKQWRQERLAFGRMAVNVSITQFSQTSFVELVSNVLAETNLPAHILELEITEGLFLRDAEGTIRIMESLKSIGVQLAVDDFGTGYSSLSYLKRLPIDRLKVDQSFIREITSDPSDAAISAAVISLAGSLNLEVIAEGVESDAQLESLRSKGCDEIQGYLLSQPVSAAVMSDILRHRTIGVARTAGKPSQCRRSVLFVDDDGEMLDLISEMLASETYQVLTARNADEAFDVFARHRVQVVVADQQMPGMSGVEFLNRLVNLHPEIIRIMLSGNCDMEAVIAAINSGAIYKFMEKPVTAQTMRATIRKALVLHDQRAIANDGEYVSPQLAAGQSRY